MAKTLVSDVVIPDVWVPYVIERTAELSEFITSGIVQSDAQFDALIQAGGKLIDMPFWQDLDGDDEVPDDSSSLTPGKIVASQDVAVKVIRARAWAYNDLAGLLAGSDPGAAIGDLVAAYKARRLQAQLFSTLKGVFAAASMAVNTLDLHVLSGGATPTSANILTGTTFIDGKLKLGDRARRLTAIIVHSSVEGLLRKLGLIDTLRDQDGQVMIESFQGLRLIVDDTAPTETVDSKTVYTSYLFGAGAIAMGNYRDSAPLDGGFGTWEVEFERDALAGDTNLVHRWGNFMHPRGVKFANDTVTGKFPSNSDLEVAANWVRVWESKNVPIVRIRSNVISL